MTPELEHSLERQREDTRQRKKHTCKMTKMELSLKLIASSLPFSSNTNSNRGDAPPPLPTSPPPD